jgi:hypothetical protein
MRHLLRSASLPSGLALFLALAHAGPAWAGAPVLVAGFQPVTPESAGLAAMLGAVLEQRLDELDELEVLSLVRVPPLSGTDVALYLETCPAGEQVGCTFVVSQHAGAEYAVTGSVALDQDQVLVWVSLVDVDQAREAVSLDLVIPPGQDHLLMEQVASLLGRVIRGELGQLEDIREEGAYDESTTRELVQAELEELAAETGAEVQISAMSTGLTVQRPDFTPADLEAMRSEEGLTEWERLGMGERAYLEYRNSGMDLESWRTLASGRMLQLLVRPRAGVLFGPVGGEYLGAFLQDPSLSGEAGIVETYAWQATRGGVGGGYGLDLGLGITPAIELELGVARVHGRYTTTIRQEVVGDEWSRPDDPIEGGNASLLLSGGLRLVPFPTHKLRPLVGAGVITWRGSQVDDHVDLSSLAVELPVFPAPALVGARAVAGFELWLGPRWDLVAQVPLCLLVGDFVEIYDEGVDALDTKDDPPGPVPFSAGLEVGVQLRLGGRNPASVDTRHGQYDDEDELDLLE